MSEKHYRCIKKFYLPLCDDDGIEVESGEMVSVDVGETFYRSDVTWMSDVRLESGSMWVEINEETFSECFEVIDE